MRWVEIVAELGEVPEDWAPYISVFSDHGIPNTMQVDSPPSIVACVTETDSWQQTVDEITSQLNEIGPTKLSTRIVPNEDWEALWKQHFLPQRIGERIVVRPSWDACALNAQDIEIVLDPGQAFGTGDHPTTRMCLQLLQEVDFEGKTVADIGCGSGILSIGAKKLGASKVVGMDIEPVCIEISKANALLNGTDIEFLLGRAISDLDSFAAQYDVVLSNITSATLISMTPHITARLKPGGRWIMSGIFQGNFTAVKETAEKHGIKFDQQLAEGEWMAALGTKN